jgi:hypothetical protein
MWLAWIAAGFEVPYRCSSGGRGYEAKTGTHKICIPSVMYWAKKGAILDKSVGA